MQSKDLDDLTVCFWFVSHKVLYSTLTRLKAAASRSMCSTFYESQSSLFQGESVRILLNLVKQ